MKKKLIISILIVVIIIITINVKVKEPLNIEEYESDIKCTLKSSQIDNNENEVVYISNIYIDLEDDYISKVIYQSIETTSALTDSDIALIRPIIELYDEVNGIDSSLKIIDDNLITTIKYDYNVINIELFKETLGDLLSEDNILYNRDNLNITYEEFKEKELNGYTCK